LLNIRMSDLAVSRNLAVTAALKAGATELLWLDSDHEFPPSIYHDLHGTGHAIVGATYIKRQTESEVAHAGTHGPGDVVPVDVLPGGLNLVRADVYRRIAWPWYETKFDPATGRHATTDYVFASRARAAGFTCWLHKPL